MSHTWMYNQVLDACLADKTDVLSHTWMYNQVLDAFLAAKTHVLSHTWVYNQVVTHVDVQPGPRRLLGR